MPSSRALDRGGVPHRLPDGAPARMPEQLERSKQPVPEALTGPD
ncbi:hypothetical protein [Teichococcus deserti]|nr:hypothetical protein [Pseudoroseomonas deserti]